MAIIKCPECGRQVSDKAPICPSCGVEIAGKVTTCPQCGCTYFTAIGHCPSCTQSSTSLVQSEPPVPPTSQVPPTPPVPPMPPVTSPATPIKPPTSGSRTTPPPPPPTEKNKTTKKIVLFSFIFALIVCGGVYYLYSSANSEKEKEAYEYAMQSNDPSVLQSFLDNYKDADQAHIDSIRAHLNALMLSDSDWTNAVVSGSKTAIEEYLLKYPDSPHKQEAYNKIDSIDWQTAKNTDTAEGYQTYLDAHVDGNFISEAENAMKKAKSRDLQPEEKDMVSGLFRKFFQSINSRNEDGLTDTCEDILSSLLGKPSATKQDVITFMNKLYKEDVADMTWRLVNDFNIKKREVGDGDYEYQVVFSAQENVIHTDGNTSNDNFKITATVSPDGKISSLNMARISSE